LLSAIEETIKILKNFNSIEIRNSVVMYLALQSIKEKGFNSIMTGDGADELFAGYNFFLKMKESQLDQELKRIWEVMHFPTKKIAHDLKIKVESPFLNEKIIDLAKSIPVNLKVREEGNTIYGKWILRKIFEEKIPKTIVWRKKSPMQDGAGTTGLINLFESVILDEDYKNRIKQIQKSDNVIIQTKESLHYYDIYKKYFEPPYKLHSSTTKCPKCQFQVKPNAKFCRMCGSYPI
jgi:asparagine synthase (glutamine-hydrolysing)